MDPEKPQFPAPEYSETVLAHNFRDACRYFLAPLLDIHRAHTLMLARCGIISDADARTLLQALDGVCRQTVTAACYDGRHEDLFFYVEDLIAQACGADTAGRMHTARSRNDIDITLYRIVIRQELLQLVSEVLQLRGAVIEMACAHADSLMPAYTHTQPAQPTTLAHYLAAVSEFLGRDLTRLQAAFATVNVNPLGACAITTTGFPIDRQMTTRLLGFEAAARNSYDAIGGVDYVLQSLAAVSTLVAGIGKLTQDLLLWSTQEFGFLRLSDAFVQISSIMPQKRNPVALEHVRVLCSKALGQCMAATVCVHNTPFGDIVDVEDDLQPLILTAFEDAGRAVRLLGALTAGMEFDRERMRQQAGKGYLTVTELADTLVRVEGLPFRAAHAVVQEALRAVGGGDAALLPEKTLQALRPVLKREPRLTLAGIAQALDPEHFVAVRTVLGGPARERVGEQLCKQAGEQNAVQEWYDAKFKLVTEYTTLLREESR